MAIDRLIDLKGELAALSPATMERLNAALPPTWSHANPVDIIGDAPPERYKAAVGAVAADPATDVVLVMNCPTGLGSPLATASAVAAIFVSRRIMVSLMSRRGRTLLDLAECECLPQLSKTGRNADCSAVRLPQAKSGRKPHPVALK